MTFIVAGHPASVFCWFYLIVVCVHTTFAATPTRLLLPPKWPPHLRPPRSRQRFKAICSWFIEATQPRSTLTNAKHQRTAVIWNKIGVAYHHMFALDQARKYYQQALAMNPSYADALNNLAAVYHGQHEYKQAERTYKQALKYSPNAAITYCNLGTAYFADEKYKPGMEAYHKALALKPQHLRSRPDARLCRRPATRRQLVAVNYYLAKTYATAGKMQESLSYLRKALEAGFKDRKQLMKDKEFAALRSTPEFHQLMLEQTGGE